jgi:hypothetical protein
MESGNQPAWSTLDRLAVSTDPRQRVWSRENATVALWEREYPVLFAVEVVPFGPATRLVADLRTSLPTRFELRCGPGAAGVLASHYDLEMIGPFVRLVSEGRAGSPPVLHDAGDAASIRDPDSPVETAAGWIVLHPNESPGAACGVVARHPGVVALTAPRLDRRARNPDSTRALLDLARLGVDRAVLDIRIDRADRIAWVEAAGFVRVGLYERWIATRRFGERATSLPRRPAGC